MESSVESNHLERAAFTITGAAHLRCSYDGRERLQTYLACANSLGTLKLFEEQLQTFNEHFLLKEYN